GQSDNKTVTAPSASNPTEHSSGQQTQTPYGNQQSGSGQAITPTAAPAATATTTKKDGKKDSVSGDSGSGNPESTNFLLQPPSPIAAVLEFFDLSTRAGWLRFGLLLLILGGAGSILLRKRKQAS